MKILAVQNRMGIGDTVIFLPFIKALSKKYNSPISILVKENTKAEQFLYETNYIDKILLLERDRNNNNHGGFFGTFKLINYIKEHKFDKIFIFNSSLRFYLIAKLCGIPEIFQYPLFKKTNQQGHGFSNFYEKKLEIFKNKKINILEIGSYAGSSAAAFVKYLPNSKVFCFDINISNFEFKSKNIHVFGIDINDETKIKKTLNHILNQYKIEKFDVIIDDGSHFLSDIFITYLVF